jgi:toxin-antitoxin system PIN domain toxin
VKCLLDVNLLIAAIWRNHADHQKADAWTQGRQMAICPITELGFLRISTHPRGLNADMAAARSLLEDFLAKHSLEFVPCDLPALASRAASSKQVTDMYLAELASARGMKLATLDMGIQHPAVITV